MATLSVRKTARWYLGKLGLLSLKHDIFSVNTGHGAPPLSLRNQLVAIHRDMEPNQADERGIHLRITIDNPPGLSSPAVVVGNRITVTGAVSYEYNLGEFAPTENWIQLVDYVEVSAGSVVQRAVKSGSTWSRWEAHLTLSDDAAAKGITEIEARVYSDNLMSYDSVFVYTLYPYPENDLEILREYFPPDLRQQLPNMIAALQEITTEGLRWGLDSLQDKPTVCPAFAPYCMT
jgi:hypothetical protein